MTQSVQNFVCIPCRKPLRLHKPAAEGDLKEVRKLCRDESYLLNERDDMVSLEYYSIFLIDELSPVIIYHLLISFFF